MLKTYFLTVSAGKGLKLRQALSNETPKNPAEKERIRRVLSELHGLGQIDRGANRQMVLSRAEFRLVRDLNERHAIGIEVQNL